MKKVKIHKTLLGCLAANLRAEREKRGLSREKFARILDVSTTYVGYIEDGKREPSLSMIQKFAGKLHCDPLTLLKV